MIVDKEVLEALIADNIQTHGIMWEMYKWFLEAEKDSDIVLVDKYFEADDEEGWETPPGFIPQLEMDNVSTTGFSIGLVQFGTINGSKVILEQNASPIMVYIRKQFTALDKN